MTAVAGWSARIRVSALLSRTISRPRRGRHLEREKKSSPAGKKRNRQGSRCQPRSLYAQQAKVPKSASNSGRKRSISSLTADDKVSDKLPAPLLPATGFDDPVMSLHPRVVFRAHLSSQFCLCYSVILCASLAMEYVMRVLRFATCRKISNVTKRNKEIKSGRRQN